MSAVICLPCLLWLLCLPALQAQAAEWGHWKETEQPSARWSDFAEAKPDIFPDAWLVSKLAAVPGEEIMLRSSNGAMLRWVPLDRLQRLDAVKERIERVAETEVALYLTRGDSPNAAAGIREGEKTVFVNFGMLDIIEDRESEWAALLGHEIAHLKLEHADKQSRTSIPLTVLKTVSRAVLAADPLANIASGMLLDSIGLKFSRDHEREADYMGVIWAIEADFNAYGAASLHERMNARTSGHPLPFLSSHPSGPERVETLRKLADRLTGKSATP